MLLFTINFGMYVYKYEFEENKGIRNVLQLYSTTAVLITNKHYLHSFDIVTLLFFVRTLTTHIYI